MITAVPKEQITLRNDLKKDYTGINKERLVAFPESVVDGFIKDSIILDELEKDLDNLDGVKIRSLLKLRHKKIDPMLQHRI